MKKYKNLILVLVVIVGIGIFLKKFKSSENISADEFVPVKVEQIDYKVQSFILEDGAYVYLEVRNNSDVDLYGVFADVDDGKEVHGLIECYQNIKAHGKSDNCGDLENSNDDRVKIPVTGKDKIPVRKVGDIKVKELEYLAKIDGEMKIISYDMSTKKYFIRNWQNILD